MAADPSFLPRARRDLDAVLGEVGRLPTFEDMERLLIISACVKEVLRWMPLVSTGAFPQIIPFILSLPSIVSFTVCLFRATISFIYCYSFLWAVVGLLGVVRVLIQDDQFENYYFPKGTRFSPPHNSIAHPARSIPLLLFSPSP